MGWMMQSEQCGPSQPCPTGPAELEVTASGTFLWEAAGAAAGQGKTGRVGGLNQSPSFWARPLDPLLLINAGWPQQTRFTRKPDSPVCHVWLFWGFSQPTFTSVDTYGQPCPAHPGLSPLHGTSTPWWILSEHAPSSEHQGLVASTPMGSSPSQGARVSWERRKFRWVLGPDSVSPRVCFGDSHTSTVGGRWGGCGSGFWAWTPWAHLPPASSQLLLVAPLARPASARTQAPCARDCPSQKPALPILSLTWQSPITQPALRQSCSGSRGPGKRTYLHRGPFLGCREDRRGSRLVVSTGAGRKQISMGPPGPWNLSVWPVPREGGVWLLAGAREQGWNKPRCPSQVMVSSP